MGKIKKTDDTNVYEEVEQLALFSIAGGSVKWYNHFGKPEAPAKIKHLYTLELINPTPKYAFTLQKSVNLSLQCMYKKFHSSLISNSQNLEKPKCPSTG